MAASVTGREANFCPRAEGQRQSSGTETSPLTSALWGAFCPPRCSQLALPQRVAEGPRAPPGDRASAGPPERCPLR